MCECFHIFNFTLQIYEKERIMVTEIKLKNVKKCIYSAGFSLFISYSLRRGDRDDKWCEREKYLCEH